MSTRFVGASSHTMRSWSDEKVTMGDTQTLTALRKTKYLGSHPKVSGQVEARDVVFTKSGVVFEAKRKSIGFLPWATIVEVAADSREDIERRLTGTRIVFMGFFALMAKKETKVAYLVIRDNDGDWVFAVPGISAMELRSGLRALQVFVPDSNNTPGVPVAAAFAPPAVGGAADDPAVRLERLDGLLARGLITNDEHSARRAAIIDSL